jgi:VPDSG-CTERM motif
VARQLLTELPMRRMPRKSEIFGRRETTTMGAVFLACALVLSAVVASAIPLNITVDSNGNLLNTTGVASKSQYGQQNNNPNSNLAFLNQEIGRWNSNYNPDLALSSPLALNVGNIGDTRTYNALAGYNYVVFHFGNETAGSPGGWWQAFHLGGQSHLFTTPALGGQSVAGFSSARYFGVSQVPDGGATLVLLGAALGVLEMARRRLYR